MVAPASFFTVATWKHASALRKKTELTGSIWILSSTHSIPPSAALIVKGPEEKEADVTFQRLHLPPHTMRRNHDGWVQFKVEGNVKGERGLSVCFSGRGARTSCIHW
jgi:hypothetical protein